MVWENDRPCRQPKTKQQRIVLLKISMRFNSTEDFVRTVVRAWRARFFLLPFAWRIFFLFILKRDIVFIIIIMQLFLPSKWCFLHPLSNAHVSMVFFVVFPHRNGEKTTSDRIYYYFRHLFIFIQYPSEWIFRLFVFFVGLQIFFHHKSRRERKK